MAAISVILNTHKTYADNTHPVMIRISHEKKRKLIKMSGDGFNIKPNQWDKGTSLFKPSKKLNPNYQEKNLSLMQFRQRIQDCIDEWEDHGIAWTFLMLEDRLQRKPQSKLFSEAIQRFIDDHPHKPTRECLHSHMNDFQRYSGKQWEILTCSDIGYTWVTGYMNFANDKGLSDYTLKHRLKTIAATLNFAIREGIASKETYPFSQNESEKHVSIKSIKVSKTHRTLPEMYIKDFFDYPCFLSDYDLNWKIHIFRILADMNFRNVIEIKNSDIKLYADENNIKRNGISYYNYQFKREEIRFMTPELLGIMQHMKDHYDLFDDYAFPIIQKDYENNKTLSSFIEKKKQRYYDSIGRCIEKVPYEVKTLTKEIILNNNDIINFKIFHPEEMHAKMIFAFSHYAQGMNLIDMARLQYDDIKQRMDANNNLYEYISYKRSKTDSPIEVYLNDQLKSIIEFFENNEHIYPRVDNYLFPIARNAYKKSDQTIYDDVRKTRLAINTQLKKIAKILGWNASIAKTFSVYYGRHTYAQRILMAGGSNALIQKALGHKSIQTTEQYLEGFSTEQIAEFNKNVFNNEIHKTVS
jgi:site-specific recombinase XerD